QPLIERALGHRQRGRGGLLRLLAPVTGASAFLNNTPIVAVLAPQVAEWAERRGLSASRYLMPLSFATILGGAITVMGTSTNLVVSGLLQSHGMQPLGMFEITRIGLPVAVAGLVLLVALAAVLLPERRPARRLFADDVREFVVNTVVEPRGALDGVTVGEGGLRQLQGVFLVQVERGSEVIAPVAPTVALRGGDRLTFAGRVDLVRDLQHTRGLRNTEHEHVLTLTNGKPGPTFFEAVVSGASPLVGKTLKETKFRSHYQAAVCAIHRAGARVNEKLGTVPLKAGDTLLLLSDKEFDKRWRDRNDFLLVSHLGGSVPPSSRQAIIVGLLTLGVVLVAGLGLLPIVQASLVAAFLMLLTGVLTADEARSAVNIDVLMVIAASFGVGAAIEQSGLATTAAHALIHGFAGWGPVGLLLAIVLAVIALNEVITNNATAALIFPVVLAMTSQMHLNPRPYIIAVTVAASASFLTPIGYQTNTMVYGLGGYRFGDYARLGAPLTAVVITVIVVLVPLLWPLTAH
ncbi:MAG TPA: SLC13 family permease, partial [Longimicrobiales bacterium]